MGWDPNARCDECIHAHPTQEKGGRRLCQHPFSEGYSEVMSPECFGELFYKRRPPDVRGVHLDEIIQWAQWVVHTEGTEATSRGRAIRIASAILEVNDEKGGANE